MDADWIRIGLVLTLGGLLVGGGIEDARCREIGDRKNAAIALLAPGWWWANGASLWPGMAIQIGVAAVVFTLFAFAFARGMMGGGDVKLITALSLWLPPAHLIGMLMTMSILGGVVTLVLLVERRVRRADTAPAIEVPYGIAIAIAGLIAIREPILNQFG